MTTLQPAGPFSSKTAMISVSVQKKGPSFCLSFKAKDPFTNSESESNGRTMYTKAVSSIKAAVENVHKARSALESLLEALKFWSSEFDNPSLTTAYEEAMSYAELGHEQMIEQCPSEVFELDLGVYNTKLKHPDGVVILDDNHKVSKLIQLQLIDFDRSMAIFWQIKPWIGGMLNECDPSSWDIQDVRFHYGTMMILSKTYKRYVSAPLVNKLDDQSVQPVFICADETLIRNAVLEAGVVSSVTLDIMLSFVPKTSLQELLRLLYVSDPSLSKSIDDMLAKLAEG